MEQTSPKKFETEVRLNREMTLMDATLIGVGAMIGAGIFVLIGIAAGVAGPALILASALNGFVALFTAMSYAELGSCFHDAGGGYLWAKEGLPRWNGFVAGWMSWFAHAVACSLYALGFGAYFEHVLREFGVMVPHWGFLSPQKLLAAVIAMVFAYINFRGASETGKIGNMVTTTKIVILMIFVAFGLEMILRTANWKASFTPFMPNGWSGIFKAMGLTFIAFEGYEVIAQISEEIENPKKNIPRAIFLSLVIVIPIYLLIAVTALGSVKPEGITAWDYLASQKETALVDTVLQKAPSEVAVLHGEFGREKIRKILIPFGTSIHTRLATEIAPALGAHFGAKLSVVVVFDPDTPVYGRDKRLSEVRQVMEQSSVWADLKVVTEKDVLKGVLKEAADADLVLMGGRTGDFLELLLSKSLSEEITEQVKCPVLWVREYEEPRSLWAALLKPAKRGKG